MLVATHGSELAENETSPVLERLPLWQIKPSPENDKLYRPPHPGDPDDAALAKSIKEHGLHEPIVVTLDYWIVSGHRRYLGCKLAGLRIVPVTCLDKRRDEYSDDEFVRLLREHNRQRIKTADEVLREELVTINPDEAYRALIDYRTEGSRVEAPSIVIVGHKRRATITEAKRPMLGAILAIVEERRRFWPLSDRQIHYALLNDPPLRHASKPASRYANDKASYKDLTNLLTRARLAGEIPMQAIGDETRPVRTWKLHQDCRAFLRRELNDFAKGYRRNLLQSQPNHVEILGEKNTLFSIIRPIAERFCIPFTVGRGYSSLPPRYEMAERYRKSGKEKLILLIVSDFDPDGEEIAHSFARSMRDDFAIENIHPVKVALTTEQVERFALPPNMLAKEKSPNYRKFVGRYGRNVFEVEALPPETLQAELSNAIDSVIDRAAFNEELDREKQDATKLAGVRQMVHKTLQELNLDLDLEETDE